MKVRTPALTHVLPEGIVPWVARFSGTCRCGKRVRQGTSCSYDKLTRKLVCKTCTKLAVAGQSLPVPPSPAQDTMDRVKQIYVLPKPLSRSVQEELNLLLARLRFEFAQDYCARRLLVEVLGIPLGDDGICIAMRYGEKCFGCGEPQAQSVAAVWCKSAHRIWCLECYAARR